MTTETRKPIWVSQDGRKFFSPKDFDDNHLINMIPFLAKGIKALSQVKEMVDDDVKVLMQTSIDCRLDLSTLLLEEIRCRGLEELFRSPQIEDWEQEFYNSFSYYNKPWN